MSTLDFLNQGLDSQAGHQSAQNYTREGVYAPKLKDAPSGTYKAKLRFLPNMTDPSKTFNGLIFYRFRDAFGENTIYIPSKKNWGERCPISELGFKLQRVWFVVSSVLWWLWICLSVHIRSMPTKP